ncbi:MAG: DinB family protein [Bryobacterales bacterium]|nr:DinB family protein [Bryobacterales bacterium]
MKLTSLLLGILYGGAAFAQNPLVAENKVLYEGIRNNIIRAAEKMPEDKYSYKPTPEVRSFAQLIGHISDAQYLFCSPVKGEKKSLGIEKSKSAKADLTAAVKEAFAYCDSAYDALTDAQARETVKFFGRDRSKLNVLYFNSAHNNEHYGNIVTYMRLNGLVPPSSERR